MSLLKNILSPFIEFKQREEGNPAEETEPQTTEGEKNPLPSAHPPVPSSGGSPSQFQQYFEDLVEEANRKNPLFGGTDFKEFMDSKTDVEAIADEGTRYRTAFNILKRTGLTKEKLVSTGREYLKLIERDMKGFEEAYVQQYRKEVEEKGATASEEAEEVQALNEKITALNEEMKQLSQQVIQNKEALNQNKASFLSAGEQKKNEIQTELEKIDQYFS